jgi:hypothetical protein
LTHVKNDAELAQTYINIAEDIENEEMRDRKREMRDAEPTQRPLIIVEEEKDSTDSQDIYSQRETNSGSRLQIQVSTELGKTNSANGSRGSIKQVAVHDPKDGSITIFPPKGDKHGIKPEKKLKIDMWRQQVSFPSDQPEPPAKETKEVRDEDSDSGGEEGDKSHDLTEARQKMNDLDSERQVIGCSL